MEFIQSFRDDVNSTIPDFNLSYAEKAFDKIKEVRDALSNGIYIINFFKVLFKIWSFYYILY